MKIAIRYQSRGGHVKEMAEIISEGVGVEPISIDDPRAPITEHVDLLFIGGALYKFALDPSLEEYIAKLPEGIVSKAIVFGSSLLTHRPVLLINERIKARGIDVHPSTIWMRGKPKPYLHEIGVPWAKREAQKIEDELFGNDEDASKNKEQKTPIEMLMESSKEKKAKVAADAADGAAGEK